MKNTFLSFYGAKLAKCSMYSMRLLVVLGMLLAPVLGTAALLNLPQFPLNIGQNPPPLTMLVMSKDQQIFKKAYTDYENTDDGDVSTGYQYSKNYYGYFDPYKCYGYSTDRKRFEPENFTDNKKYCNKSGSSGSQWSGNFLNWVSMTRIDLIRKALYGGLRSPDRQEGILGIQIAGSIQDGDKQNSTVLERANLTWDAHAFVKHYRGADITRLTPFKQNQVVAPIAGLSGRFLVERQQDGTYKFVRFETQYDNNPVDFAVFDLPYAQVADANNQTASFSVPIGGNADIIDGVNPADPGSELKQNGVTLSGNIATGDHVYLRYCFNLNDGPRGTNINCIRINATVLSKDSNAIKLFGISSNPDMLTLPANNNHIYGSLTQVGSTNQYHTAWFSNPPPTGGAGWQLFNLSRWGVSFCNTTDPKTGGNNQYTSNQNLSLPKIKVARGNYSLWAAAERAQCVWQEDIWNGPSFRLDEDLRNNFTDQGSDNNNLFSFSHIPAYRYSPSKAAAGSGEYFARVQVCKKDPDLINYPSNIASDEDALPFQEKCKYYNNTAASPKPIGLLQRYGDNGAILFGMMMGSYSASDKGGVLRKNIGNIANEINQADGTFKTFPASPALSDTAPGDPAQSLTGGGLIQALNSLQLINYNYAGTTHGDGACGPYGIMKLDNFVGGCKNWGNPISEIYLETLKYFAAQPRTDDYNVSGEGTLIPNLLTADWPFDGDVNKQKRVVSNKNYCAPLKALVINPAVASVENVMNLGLPNPGNSYSVAAATNTVGRFESFRGGGKRYMFGGADGLCTPGSISTLSTVSGICPEGPTLGGTYGIAGMAHYAHTTRMRIPSGVAANTLDDTRGPDRFINPALKVDTATVSLASALPRIPIVVGTGANAKTVTIVPAIYGKYRSSRIGGGHIVDARFISKKGRPGDPNQSGSLYVNWEDSEMGNDYDQDMWGRISYEVYRENDVDKIKVSTVTVGKSTPRPYGFGYVIVGVSGEQGEGAYFDSGINGFGKASIDNGVAVNPVGLGSRTICSGTSKCVALSENPSGPGFSSGEQSRTFTVTGNPDALQDPLYYAAKYGGFTKVKGMEAQYPANFRNKPHPLMWDKYNVDGSIGSDGVPDLFFDVGDPSGLERSLDRALQGLLGTASNSAPVADSGTLTTDTRLYQVKYDPNEWTSTISAYTLDPQTGTPSVLQGSGPQGQWNATLPAANNRKIFTVKSDKTPIPFGWSSLSTEQKGQLSRLQGAAGNGDTIGQKRLNYLRGDRSNELTPTLIQAASLPADSASKFRYRNPTATTEPPLLGDIVNSNLVYVGAPGAAGYLDDTYKAFAASSVGRTKMLYVGANDGMLHAFDAETGVEKFAYVPSMVFPSLSQLTRLDYSHRFYVDGPLVVKEAQFGSGQTSRWATVLAGTLGGGGRGVFLLDVTNPNAIDADNDASRLIKWEFSEKDDPDMGYVYGRPVIAKMANGKWAMIVSGGYNNRESDNSSGNATLFILFLDGPTGNNRTWTLGTDYIKLTSGTGDYINPNGFGAPLAVTAPDAAGTPPLATQYIYAGDLNGMLWRFDVRGTTLHNWTLATSRKALFNAKTSGNSPESQPITAAPVATVGPGSKGIFLIFGTGKSIEPADMAPLPGGSYRQQSLYGVWDKLDPNAQTPIQRDKLMKQELLTGLNRTETRTGNIQDTFEGLSAYQPNYDIDNRPNPPATSAYDAIAPGATSPGTTTPPQLGWVFDLPDSASSGERMVSAPRLLSFQAVSLPTQAPAVTACTSGGKSWDNILNIYTGGRTTFQVFDVNADGKINRDDMTQIPGTNKPYAQNRHQSPEGVAGNILIIQSPLPSAGVAGGNAQTAAVCRRQFFNIAQDRNGNTPTPSAIYAGNTCRRVSWREMVN